MFDLLNIPWFFHILDEINSGNYFYIFPISIFLAFVIINETRKIIKRNSNHNSKNENENEK